MAFAALAGCHFHRDTNAPGITDVENAPPPDARRVEPADPGENMLAVNPGILWGAGGREGDSAFGELSVEVSVVRGSTTTSHYEDGIFIYPVTGTGAALGWSAVRFAFEEGDEIDAGPIYAEAYAYRFGGAGGGGYAWNPVTGDHGPQAFAFFSSLYVRGRYMFDAGGEISAGLQLKLPLVWVWSR